MFSDQKKSSLALHNINECKIINYMFETIECPCPGNGQCTYYQIPCSFCNLKQIELITTTGDFNEKYLINAFITLEHYSNKIFHLPFLFLVKLYGYKQIGSSIIFTFPTFISNMVPIFGQDNFKVRVDTNNDKVHCGKIWCESFFDNKPKPSKSFDYDFNTFHNLQTVNELACFQSSSREYKFKINDSYGLMSPGEEAIHLIKGFFIYCDIDDIKRITFVTNNTICFDYGEQGILSHLRRVNADLYYFAINPYCDYLDSSFESTKGSFYLMPSDTLKLTVETKSCENMQIYCLSHNIYHFISGLGYANHMMTPVVNFNDVKNKKIISFYDNFFK